MKSNSIYKLLILIGLIFSFGLPAEAKLVHQSDAQVKGMPHSHVNVWFDDSKAPKGIVIALHGLIMHGGVFDTLAGNLVDNGYTVIAADMRGYGRWSPSTVNEEIAKKYIIKEDGFSDLAVRVNVSNPISEKIKYSLPKSIKLKVNESQQFLENKSEIKYTESYKDLLSLTKSVKANYPNLPVYLVGESMGAGMAMHIASDAPDCVDGLVLSSPAIKRQSNLLPRVVVDAVRVAIHPKKQLDLIPYIRKFASEDPVITKACLKDPMVRKNLSVAELYMTMKEIRKNIKFADTVPEDIPVLIIQGDKDRMVKCNGVALLLKHLKSKDQTVKWFHNKGHLLLETPYITSDTLNVVEQWLEHHTIQNSSKISYSSVSPN